MNKKNILLPVSIAVLGGCMVLSSWMISNRLEPAGRAEPPTVAVLKDKALLTSEEAAAYMGIPSGIFNYLIETQIQQKAGLQTYNTYKFIPFIMINNDKYFNKKEIDKWIDYNMLNS